MPMYNYQCNSCELEIEKFLHHSKQEIEFICEKCGCKEFTKLFNKVHNRISLDAKGNLSQKILPDAQRIMNNIKKGRDKDFLDVVGD